MKKRLFSLFLAFILLAAIPLSAYWRYNPFTRKMDYYAVRVDWSVAGEVAGDILYFDGTSWTNLPIGANTEVLTLAAGLPTWAVAAGGGAPTGADYLTLALNGALTAERVLTAGSGIAFADTGANGTLTISSIPNMANIIYVSPTGGDYATITTAMAAESAGGEVFLVGPGTYANDEIDFSANGQTVIGMGHMDDVHVTHADAVVIRFGAFTDCVVMNVHVEVTAPSTAAADVIAGTGSLYLYDVHVELTNTNVVVADQPACIDTTGIVSMVRGFIEYANTGNDGSGNTAIKAAVRIAGAANVDFSRVEFLVTGGNQSLAITPLYATAGVSAFYWCLIDVDDDASSNTVGVIYSNMAAGTHEMFGNDIVVDNANNIAHGVFLINAETMRSMFNHIEVTGSTAYGLNAEAGTTIISQFDDIEATTPTQGAGTITYVHSHSDGDFRVSGRLYGATYGSDGSITDAEFLYINTLSSNAQTQLNGKAPTAHAMDTHSDDDTYNISTSGTAGTGEITVADGGGINLQEDITFTGATTVNQIRFPDNLADALSLQEGANKYITIITTNDEEDIVFYKPLHMYHTAVVADDHALEIDVDAANLGDIKAINIDYITGTIAAGQDEGIILVNIDETDATGGDVFGLEVLATEGSAGIYGMKVGVVIGPVHQDSGTFINPDTGTDNTTSTDVPNMIDGNPATTTAIFENDNEYILIGDAAVFEEIEFIITTGASGGGIAPTFWYSTAGSHTFTQFTPVDGTNGFKNTGVVAWDASDLTAHGVNTDTSTYDIKIIRTRNTLGTTPILGYAKTAATTEYIWDKDGDVNIKSLVIDDGSNIGSVSDPDAIAIASGGEVTLSQTLILSDVINAATDTDKFLVLDGSDNVDYRTGVNVLADLSGTAGAAFAWNGQNITGLNSIYLVEQAEADADIGGSGQIWVDADNPNTLWFTDEDGTDVQLGVGGDSFKLKVDAGATEDYFGVAGGDGLFRFTANEFTMADGGNFVTLSLADHATARSALGLGTTDDPTFNDTTVDKIEANECFTYDAFQTDTGDGDNTIDWGLGNNMYFTFGAQNCIIRFTAPPGSAVVRMIIKQDGVGSRTIDWSNIANILWPGNVEPTLSTGANEVDIVIFLYDGTSWFGLFNGNFS